MGYKLLGFTVWHGARWYVRRRFPGMRRKLAISGLAALLIGGGVAGAAAARQSNSE